MSDAKGDGGYKVGRGKPPKHSQFKPGTSGNPAGRKPKRRDPSPVCRVPPTIEMLREEATRLVAVKEGERRTSIPTTRAVIRSLSHNAIKGGVLAQRTYLEYVFAEDAREFREREAIFDKWYQYVQEAEKALERAVARGESIELIPHPEDIVLNYSTLDVRFVGPCNAKQAINVRQLKQMSDLFYELSRYYDEPLDYDPADRSGAKVGRLYYMFLLCQLELPPRLRGVSPQMHEHILRRACLRQSSWRAHLDGECEKLGVPPFRLRGAPEALTLREWGWPVAGAKAPG